MKQEEPSLEGYFKWLHDELKKSNIPSEVFVVFQLQKLGCPIGTETYNKCQEVIKKYPEHFPWEAKYNSIPQEVHDAYSKELMDEFKSKFDSIPKGDGLMKSLVSEGASKPRLKNFGEALRDMDNMFKEQHRQAEERLKKSKQLWDKHYKKYNLKYRP